jgi:hypothetical protein
VKNAHPAVARGIHEDLIGALETRLEGVCLATARSGPQALLLGGL